MANPEQLAKLDEGVEAWNRWRASQAFVPDLMAAALIDKDLSGADLRGADLREADLNKTELSGASLREANLQGVDLSVAHRGLQTEQFAGADLTAATLPQELNKQLVDALENVNNISESARKLFLAVLAACLYSWLTIATTTDNNLITNRASSPLPIIQTSIPIVGFYWVAPLLLLCVWFYFHFYLQKLWEELGSLPAVFPDGRPLHAKTDPWLLNDLVRAHLPKLNVNRPFLSYLQLWISVLLAWWVVPITLFLFWGRYLPRHEWAGTIFHVVLLVMSITAALRLYRLAVATLRGVKRRPFTWRDTLTSPSGYKTAAFTVVVGMLFGVVSWGARWGVPSKAPILGVPLLLQQNYAGSIKGRVTWVPRLMALVGYSPFANLTGAEISEKKSTSSKNNRDSDCVARGRLEGADLRYALAINALLADADLKAADLTGAFLYQADLSGANLRCADLSGADLRFADLSGAQVTDAKLNGAVFDWCLAENANLSGNNFRSADIQNAIFKGANLSGAQFGNTQMNHIDLSDAKLEYARLSGAIINDAVLEHADLVGADLTNARVDYGTKLNDAILDRANLSGVDLTNADLTYTDFRGAKNLDLKAVKRAFYWEKGFYDDEIVKALGLPSDHNDKLSEQQKKEEEKLQQKQNARKTALDAVK